MYTYNIVEENNPLRYGGGGEKLRLFLIIWWHLGKWEVKLESFEVCFHSLTHTAGHGIHNDMAVVNLTLVFVAKSAGLRVAGLNRSRFGKS